MNFLKITNRVPNFKCKILNFKFYIVVRTKRRTLTHTNGTVYGVFKYTLQLVHVLFSIPLFIKIRTSTCIKKDPEITPTIVIRSVINVTQTSNNNDTNGSHVVWKFKEISTDHKSRTR